MALNQATAKKRRKAQMSEADRQMEAIVSVLHRHRRVPQGQAALVVALIRAMGGTSGISPSLIDIATQLGVCHQRVYRTLAQLEAAGVVRRNVLEISL